MLRQAARACARAAVRTTRPAATTAVGRSLGQQLVASAVASSYHGGLWVAMAATGLAGSTTIALAQTAREQSFIMVKPDGVQRGKVSDIIRRFEERGLKLVGIKVSVNANCMVLVPTRDLAAKHYGEHKGKPFFDGLVDFLSSGPVVAMVWEGDNMAAVGRQMLGATKPQQSAAGTIRGDLGLIMGRNLCHASDSPESAQKEIALWFTPAELAQYELAMDKWIYED